jgi:hypothetical protein
LGSLKKAENRAETMDIEGYSPMLLLLALGLGVPYAIVRPYRAFLAVVFFLTSANFHRFNRTRLPGLGPYLNLWDALALVACVALLNDLLQRRERAHIPGVFLLLVGVVTIGACQSFWKLGWTYQTLSIFRHALDVPIGFLLGSNLVCTRERARGFYVALLAGAVAAGLQHIFFSITQWRLMALSMARVDKVRTISYMAGHLAPAFVVSWLVWRVRGGAGRKIACLGAALILAASIFLEQTRTVWISMLGAYPILLLMTRAHVTPAALKKAVVALVLILLVFGLCEAMLPGFDAGRLVAERVAAIFKQDYQRADVSRLNALRVEVGHYLQGTLVFGRGLAFFQTLESYSDLEYRWRVAFGHMGYATYLSQLGLVGLVLYGVYFPLRVGSDGYNLACGEDGEAVRKCGQLACASIVFFVIAAISSAHLLAPVFLPTAILFGAVWRLARPELMDRDQLSIVRNGLAAGG